MNVGDSTIPVPLQHLFVKVNFYQQHSRSNRFGNPDIIVTYPHYDNDMGFCAFLPLQRLRGICAHGTLSMPLGDNNVQRFTFQFYCFVMIFIAILSLLMNFDMKQ